MAQGTLNRGSEGSKNMKMIYPIGKDLPTGLFGIPPVRDIV